MDNCITAIGSWLAINTAARLAVSSVTAARLLALLLLLGC